MLTGAEREASPSAATCAVTHGTSEAEFVDLLVADDAWVDQEFDALVAAEWGDAAPPRPAPQQRARWPRQPGYDDRPTSVPRPTEAARDTRTRSPQRGPPGVPAY
jgi:hypothetical protein